MAHGVRIVKCKCKRGRCILIRLEKDAVEKMRKKKAKARHRSK